MGRSKFLLIALLLAFYVSDVFAQFIMPDTIPDQDIEEVVVVAKLPELVNLLKATPASTADKIDLITHPSARYDASGNSGLIDIHTKKIKLQGLNLSVNGGFSQGIKSKGNGSFSLNRRNGKFNFYLTYSFYKGNDQHDLEINRLYSSELTGLASDLKLYQDSYSESPYVSHYYRAGVDFYLSPQTTIGVSTNGNIFHGENEGDMDSSFSLYPQTAPDSTAHTLNLNDRHKTNFSGGISLTHRFDSVGKVLDASFDYLNFHSDEDQFIYNSFRNLINQAERQDSMRGDIKGNINLYAGQINMKFPFENSWVLNAGVKSSYVSIDNEALYVNRIQNAWSSDEGLTQGFSYKENINAAYIEGSARLGELSVQAGLRLENTRYKGRQTAVACDSSFSDHSIDLFPTVLLEYALGENKLSLFYGKRINRPNYGDLNPSTYIFDNYTYERGNTLLKPEKTDNLELSYTFKDLFKAAFLFSYTSKAMVKSYIVEENKRVFVTPLNLNRATSLGPRVNTGILSPVSFWNLSANAAFVYNRYQWSEELSNKVNEDCTWIAGLNNQFSFGKGWSAELSGYYNGRMAAGQATISPVWQVNCGIQKSILKNKATVSLFARDIFHSYRYNMELTVPGQRAFTKERYDNTLVGVSFSWRFSKGYETKESGRKSDIDQSKRINL